MARAGRTVLYLALGLLLVGLALAASVAWARFGPRDVPAGQPPLHVVDGGGDALRAAFNAGAGHPRVLALLSPT